jgi:hypothetical protein
VLGARYLFAPAHLGACRVDYHVPDGWNVHHPSGARRISEDVTAWSAPGDRIRGHARTCLDSRVGVPGSCRSEYLRRLR